MEHIQTNYEASFLFKKPSVNVLLHEYHRLLQYCCD